MTHNEVHPNAGQKVKVTTAVKLWQQNDTTIEYIIEDWWDRVTGKSWMNSDGNPAAINYAVRAGLAPLPLDDEVVYGKCAKGYGHLVHVSEIVTLQGEY